MRDVCDIAAPAVGHMPRANLSTCQVDWLGDRGGQIHCARGVAERFGAAVSGPRAGGVTVPFKQGSEPDSGCCVAALVGTAICGGGSYHVTLLLE